MNANIFEKANRIVKETGEAAFGLVDEEGAPTVSMISSIRTDGIFQAWFATGLTGAKAQRIRKNPKASVCYREGGDNVTLVGEASLVTEQETRHALWQDWFINHFPLGMDDPDYVVIAFRTKRVSLWIDNESAKFSIRDLLKVQSRCGLLCDGCAWRESHGCKGCVASNGQPFYGACPVAACCQRKGYLHCGECPDTPCEKLHAYSCTDPEHGDQPAGARLAVLDSWKRFA